MFYAIFFVTILIFCSDTKSQNLLHNLLMCAAHRLFIELFIRIICKSEQKWQYIFTSYRCFTFPFFDRSVAVFGLFAWVETFVCAIVVVNSDCIVNMADVLLKSCCYSSAAAIFLLFFFVAVIALKRLFELFRPFTCLSEFKTLNILNKTFFTCLFKELFATFVTHLFLSFISLLDVYAFSLV